MTPLADIQGRSSPVQPTGFMASLVDAYQAFRGSPQKMTPKQVIFELTRKIDEVFNQGRDTDTEWLDRVNRLLCVLTTKGDFLLEREEDRQNILRILETVTSIYQDNGYKKRDPMRYARNDPRRDDLSYEEMLLQIIGRCKILEDLYINVHTADGRIQELTQQLRGNSEEEKRLAEKLKTHGKDAESLKKYYQEQLDEMKQQSLEQIQRLIEVNKQLSENLLSIKAENSLLKTENRSLQERCANLSYQIKNLEDDVKILKETIQKPQIKEESPEFDMTYERDLRKQVKELKREVSRLLAEVEIFNNEREEVIYEREMTIKIRQRIEDTHIKDAETIEIASTKLTGISKAVKQADKDFNAGYENPLVHSETLYKLLAELDSILKK